MLSNSNRITNSTKRINKVLNLNQNTTTFKSELAQLRTKLPCLRVCVSMKVVVDLVPEKPQTSAGNEL